jgi:hypothetical protein
MINFEIIEHNLPHYYLYKKNLDFNYFESEYYKIKILNDYKFYIYLEDNFIIIQRIDLYHGWDKNIELIIFNKITRISNIINLEKSNKNILKIEFIEDFPNEKIHYETNEYKIFYISEEYNDTFNVHYNEEKKLLLIKRLDKDESWGQDLCLKYIEKKTNKEKIIKIGPSTKNVLSKKIDLNSIDYIFHYNYLETPNYILYNANNKFLDKFEIYFSEDNNIICIRRIDENKGWGQKLEIFLYNKNLNINKIQNNSFSLENISTVFIGSSTKNEIFKKIDPMIRKCYIALTTIPSRVKLPVFFENINNLLENQTYPVENLFITIAKKYRRFDEIISDDIIERIKNIPKVILIILDEDLGPSSKYMGPFINYYELLKDNLLIIVDDDRIYNKNLVKNFAMGYNSFPNITFSSGNWVEYFHKDYQSFKDDEIDYFIKKEKNILNFSFGDGVGGFFGFCIKVQNLEQFINYNYMILDKVKDSFFHDEGIILGYLKYMSEEILYLKHKGCNFIKNEMVDALCVSGLCNREKVERDIFYITNKEELLNKNNIFGIEKIYQRKNKCLVLFIGESFRDGFQHSREKDTEKGYNTQKIASESHIKFIENLKNKNIDTDVIINTYDTKYEVELEEWYKNYLIDYISNQSLIGIEKLINNAITKNRKYINNYDFVYVCRIDLCLKDYFIEKFNPEWNKIYFSNITWRECYKTINNEPRIADVMMFIPNPYFYLFNLNIYLNHDAWFTYKTDYNLTNNDMDFMIDTYHDSDTFKDFNPLYYMVSRPENQKWHSENYLIDRSLFSTNLF